MAGLYPKNAPLFTTRMWKAEDHAEMLEVWSEPSLVTLRADVTSVTITVVMPHCTKDPGTKTFVVNFAEFLSGDRMECDEIQSFIPHQSEPQPWKLEFPRNQGVGHEGPEGHFTLVAVGRFGRVSIHLSEEGALVSPHDCVGLQMREFDIFLNGDGSEIY